MSDFFQTRAGLKLTESTLPRIARALEDIAEALTKKPEPAEEITLDTILRDTAEGLDVKDAKSQIIREFAEKHGMKVVDIKLSEGLGATDTSLSSPAELTEEFFKRFKCVEYPELSVADWVEYAKSAGLNEDLISFVEMAPEMLKASLRTLGYLSDYLNTKRAGVKPEVSERKAYRVLSDIQEFFDSAEEEWPDGLDSVQSIIKRSLKE